ncbi:MAG: isopentenyl-diphosphate Delta-isomerase [bacterium]
MKNCISFNNQAVSFKDEELILVDKNDTIVGHATKAVCHDGCGILHRAFSIFIFNDSKQLLLQKRSKQKRLWPLYWSNSCCSHPRKNEDNETATQRRLKEELGISIPLKFLFKFHYYVKLDGKGAENEYCSVYIGKSNKKIIANTNEISQLKFMDLSVLESKIAECSNTFTPWFKIELTRILKNHMQDIEDL